MQWQTLKGILRIAYRYEVESYKKAAVDLLEYMFPRNVMRWHEIAEQNLNGQSPVVISGAADFFSVVNVMAELGLDHIRYTALYDCTQESTAELLQGAQRQDGSVEKLNPDVIRGCINARSRLSMRNVQLLNSLAENLDALGCKAAPKPRCRITRRMVVNDILRDMDNRDLYNPIRRLPWKELFRRYTADEPTICASCQDRMEKAYNEGCQDILDNLPSYYNIAEDA